MPLSRAIRWFFNEDCSHVAAVFDDKLVIHSDLFGISLKWLKTFHASHEVVHFIDYHVDLDLEEQIYQTFLNAYDGSGYDYKAFLYFSWRAMLLKLFKIPLPSMNPYNQKNAFICTEILRKLPPEITKISPTLDLAVITPYMLFKILLEIQNV